MLVSCRGVAGVLGTHGTGGQLNLLQKLLVSTFVVKACKVQGMYGLSPQEMSR